MREKKLVSKFSIQNYQVPVVCPVQGCAVYRCLHDDGDLSLEHDEVLMCMGDM